MFNSFSLCELGIFLRLYVFFPTNYDCGLICSKCYRPLHLCVATWNVTVVKRWVEVATAEDIADAIDIPSPVGNALCMAAAVKKDHEIGNDRILEMSI